MADKPTEAQKRASAKYKAANIKQVKIELNKNSYDDMLIDAHLGQKENKQRYIKELILQDIKNGN